MTMPSSVSDGAEQVGAQRAQRRSSSASSMSASARCRAAARRPVQRRRAARRACAGPGRRRYRRRGSRSRAARARRLRCEWVMRMTVCPCAESSSSSAITSTPLWLSSAPVGSSARMICAAVHQRARDRHALLLAAGELVRAVVERGRRGPSGVEQLVRRARGARLAARRHRSAGTSTFSVAVRAADQVVALEHEAERLAAQLAPARRGRTPTRRAHEPVGAGRSAGRGSRGCSSASTCPSPTGP